MLLYSDFEMGMMNGDHKHNHLINFHFHHHHHGKKQNLMIRDDVPKGCLAIKVGHHGEEQQRFVVPIEYFNHPLFLQLLKEAEDEYGFKHIGTITIPCSINEFLHVQDIIEKEQESLHHQHHHHHHNQHHHQHHHHRVSCFGA